MMTERRIRLGRRSFLAKAGAGAAAAGATMGASASIVRAQSTTPEGGRFQPARHPEDDWFDRVPGKHRQVFDTINHTGLGLAIFFSNNIFTGNKNGYNLEQGDVAVVIVVRHQSTAFAYNDAMWAKYGKALAERIAFTDPKTHEAPNVNVFQTSGYGAPLTNNGTTIDAVTKRGVQFAVCQLSTRANAAAIARQTGGKADEIYEEIVAHLVPNAHMVPAGIVAVNRAQERGYTFVYTG
jgi:intracellular sulfur oxidation DsrE/DsrF family protein